MVGDITAFEWRVLWLWWAFLACVVVPIVLVVATHRRIENAEDLPEGDALTDTDEMP